MKFGKKVSLVIPTLNEGKNIGEVLKGIPSFVDEVIVVDGYSSDGTAEIAKRHGCIVLKDSFGKGSAVIKGVKNSTGDFIISMDGDLSNDPKEMGSLVGKLAEGYDLCLGSRFLYGGGTGDMSRVRVVGNAFFVWTVNRVWKRSLTDLCYGYRAFTRKAFESLQLESRGFSIETEMTIKAIKHKLKIVEIPSFERKRSHGASKLKPLQDGFGIMKIIFKEAVAG